MSIQQYARASSQFGHLFFDEPEILNALIDAFPGTDRTFFNVEGHPKPILIREIDPTIK